MTAHDVHHVTVLTNRLLIGANSLGVRPDSQSSWKLPCGRPLGFPTVVLGTKVAWGGPPVAPRTVPNRQRFELVVDHAEVDDEIARLQALGAEALAAHPNGVFEFANPDGNEFHLVVAGHPGT